MDDLAYSGEEMRKTLDELEIINTRLGGYKVVLNALDQLATRHKGRTLHIADIGCGGGDTLKNMARWAKHQKVPVLLTGIDANDYIVQYARKECQGYPNIEVKQFDVFSEGFAREAYDITVCSLFCHHFTDKQLVRMFRQLYQQSRLGVIINDLHRHWFAYYSIKYITALFSNSVLVRNDAPLSVSRAFKRDEIQQLVKQAGISKYSLRWMWAFRWQLLLQKR